MRRWLKRIVRVVVGLLLLLLVLAVGAFFWLRSSSGQAFLRDQVVDAVKGAIAGRIDFGGVDFVDGHLVLTDLKLFTPEGELVASVAKVELDVDVQAALRRDLRLGRVRLTEPVVSLVRDERGLNLSRAIAAKSPSTGGASRPLKLTADDVTLVNGSFSFVEGERRVRLERLGASASAVVTTEPLSVRGTLELTGEAKEPVPGRVAWSATVTSPQPDSLRVKTDLRLGSERVDGTFDWPAVEATIETLEVTPALIEQLSGVTLRQGLRAKGTVGLRAADLELRGGSAKVTVTGAWDLGSRTVSSARVVVSDLDLSEFLADAAPSRLDATLSGSATDLTVERAAGTLQLDGSWKTPRGTALATVEAQLSAQSGTGRVKRLLARTPGASLTLSGTASRTRLDLEGTLDATDLSKVDATITEYTGARLPPVAGRGSLAVEVAGPTTRPRVSATGALEDLRLASFSARRLELDVRVPDVSRPLDSDGTLRGSAVSFGAQTLDSLEAAVVTHGRELELSLKTKGLGDLGVSLAGTLDAGGAGLAVASLELSTGTDRWTLDEPTSVGWGRAVEVRRLSLSSGAQRLFVDGALRGQEVKARVSTRNLDLSRLPKVLVPPSLGLAGLVTLEASVEGRLPRPDVTGTLSVSDGALRGVTQVALDLQARFVSGRATGTSRLSSSLGSVEGRFDVPVDGVLHETSELLDVDLDLKALSLEALQSWRAESWPVTGTFSGRFTAKGPAKDPAVSLRLETPTFTVTRSGALRSALTFAPLTLVLATRETGALTATLDTRLLGATLATTVETPLTLPGLRARLPTAEDLRRLDGTVDLALERLELRELTRLGLGSFSDVTGRASLTARVTGSVDDPKGLVTLRFSQVKAPPLEDLEGRLELAASDSMTRLSGAGTLFGKPLYDVEAFIDAPLRRLEHLDELGAEHVTARVALAPMPLARLLPARDDEVMPTGSVTLSLDLKGTLDEPKLTVDGVVQNLSFGKVPLGQARLVSRTLGRQQSLGLTLKASGSSELRTTGTVGLDLSLPGLRRGLSTASIPLDLSVTARDFDLGFLSGVTPMVRVVGGQLTVQDFKVTGFASNPEVRGEVAWKRGRLGLASFGDYRDIDLETTVTRERVDLSRASVRAGGGAFVLEPSSAQRLPTGVWSLRASGSASRFPIVTDDQLLAILGTRFELEGEVSDELIDLTKLSLSRVDVELPELKRKDIQDLERPKDLVIVKGGRTLVGRRRTDASAPPSKGRSVRAVISAPRNLWVKSTDVNVELGLSEGFRVEVGDATQIFGDAQVLQGRIDVIGREFKVNRAKVGGDRNESSVRFAGPSTQPYVNVTALHVNEREKVKVTVSVVGRGKDVTLKVTSDPPMNESDIYALLATGRRDLRRSAGSSITAEQAVSVVGSLAANQLKNALLKRLPIDIVDVVSIDTGSEGLQSTRVEVGKYLSDSLYLGYVGQPGANKARGESVHTVRLEWQLSKDVSLEGTGGFDSPAFGADVVWSRDF